MRIFNRKRFYMIAVFMTAGLLLLNSCFTFRMSDAKVERKFRSKQLAASFKRHNLKSCEYPVRVVGGPVDADKDVALFFVHGAPGSSQDFFSYLQDSMLLSQANLYSVDRPGYGYSNFGKAEVSIQKQAQIVAELIAQLPEQKVIIVGHSFGGPIAALASVYTSKIVAAVMLAPAIDPAHEKILKIAYLGKWKATRWFVPKALRVAADEKFTHVAELSKVQNLWSQVPVPVTHYHGTKDVLVPYENIHFSTKVFEPAKFKAISLDNENHFLPWSQYELLQRELLGTLTAAKAGR
jgi:pimeloyl-ACP methyl ester carboxylesterase